MESRWARDNPGEVLDRKYKVLLACKSMVEVFTRKRILDGARKTGILPVDCRVLLAHPSIENGNALRDAFDKQCAAAVLRAAQQTEREKETSLAVNGEASASTSAAPTSPAGHIVASPQPLYATPERLQAAENTYDALSRKKVRLCKRRVLSDSNETPDEELQRVRSMIEVLARDHEARMPDWVNLALQDARESIDREIQKPSQVYSALLQEQTMLRALREKLSENVGSSTLAFVDEKIQELETAPRDKYGLAAEAHAIRHWTFPPHTACDVGALDEAVALSQRHIVSTVRGTGKRAMNADGSVPFRIGCIMHHLGEIEGTASPMAAFVGGYEARRAAEREAKESIKAAKMAKAREAQDALPALKAKIGPRAEANKLFDLRAYARALKQMALLMDDASMAQAMTDILKKPSAEMRVDVTMLAHPGAFPTTSD